MTESTHQPINHTESIAIFGYSIWQVVFWTIVLLVVLAALVFTSDLPVQTTANPLASTNEIGQVTLTLPLVDNEVEISQLGLLVGFFVIILITLVAISVLTGFASIFVHQQINRATTAPTARPPTRPSRLVRMSARLAGLLARGLRKL